MKTSIIALCLLFIALTSKSQIPINMAAQSGYTYTETFADIANWAFNTTTIDGTFTYGIGSAAWKGNVVGGSGTIPNGTKITSQTTSFQAPSTSGLPGSGSGGGVHKYYQSMLLLTTGTTDNSSAAAMDFYMDFTGLNAGTLSFDWQKINNSTGDRNGSLRIYYSTDGVTFTELAAAAVLNFTNGGTTNTSGSITNVALPTAFNNSATAQLRFYDYNGTGGTTGSRPKINLDNVKVTAVAPTVSCTAPTAQPTGFTLGTITNYSIQASFTAPASAPDNYMVVASNNTSLSNNPVNGTTYVLGDNLGEGSVVAFTHSNTFTVSGLSPSTTYNFFVFSMNSTCTGGPLYRTVSPLTGAGTTLAGGSACIAPVSQPTSLVLNNITTSSLKGKFSPAASTDEYLVVRSTSSTLSAQPVNKTTYSPGNTLGGGIVVARSSGDTLFNATGLSGGTTYYFFVYGMNSLSCNSGPIYNLASPLIGNATTTAITACATPTASATVLTLTPDKNMITGSFKPSTAADEYLVLQSTSSSLSTLPVDGTNYTVGVTLGNATVISNSPATAFVVTNLAASTTYYFYIFSKNSICTGGPKYRTTSPLTANTTTTATTALNYYFGNLHAHTVYSDGGKDNSNTNPSAAYDFAKNSLCMDYLGISEHNHGDAGMSLSSYQLGVNQATAATSSNFLALYGMEWGVISNGGHVLVYGINQLLGWETGNYNTFVPKSDYLGTSSTTGTTGLFRTINTLGNNAFATLAHPSQTDYGNIANIALNVTADSAVVGAALSSGPAFSTNTSYTDPAPSLGYYDYYKTLLSKGYHIGPSMDHDNHYTTFGRTSTTRTVFIAPSLSNTEFLKAMKERHFYATEDCDTRVSFTLNNQIMGSIFTGNSYPAMSVYVTDPTNPTATAKIKIMYGVPGSNIPPATVDSTLAGNTFSFTDYTIASGTTAYYYAEITIAGSKVITAPIWYTYVAALPVSLLDFKATTTSDKQVLLSWSTANEVNNKSFAIERSIDGVHFTNIATVEGKGTTTNVSNYNALDKQPVDGLNYYRLLQTDIDGKITYSNIISVNMQQAAINYFVAYPNPATNELVLNINAKTEQSASLIITDIYGRTVATKAFQLTKGNQLQKLDISKLAKGNYNATVVFDDAMITKKIMKL